MLKRNAKLYGPMNALNDNSSTCWNSEGSSGTEMDQQWIQVEFSDETVTPSAVCVQFQAGFAVESCTVQYLKQSTATKGGWEIMSTEEVEWDDAHQLQRKELENESDCSALRLVFEEDFADMYGRVIIYQLQIWGSE